MPATYEPIATTTLTSTTASIDFTSIPTTYTDLKLVFTGLASSVNGVGVGLRFNGDTSSSYSVNMFYGNSVNSYVLANQTRISLADSTNVAGLDNQRFSPWVIDINSYRAATWKTAIFKGGQSYWNVVFAGAGTWRSTDAINQISLIVTNAGFGVGTTATLFGILEA
jgi:hypothetical protein